jgi:signal transduction histidine kinase
MLQTISEMPEINEKVTFETLIHQSVEVEGEPKGLKQAIGHLLSNACDASRPGSVIRIVLVIDHEENEAVLEIHDSGTGISTEIRDRMFEPFATTKDDGSGLGLPIVLTVAEAHGGAVEFHNSAQGGSIFALRLPLATAHSSVGQGVGANG